MKKQNQFSAKKIIKWLLAAAIIGFLIWGVSWATYARPPLPDAVEALRSDGLVEVVEEPWLTFSPTQSTPKTGFIFYPGGRVDPKGYAPLLRPIAAEGYLVIVPEMPINMAVFKPNRADEIITHYPDITRWLIGGHSVGGTMAAQYTDQHLDVINGLVIWASYPAESANLSNYDGPVFSIYGSMDPGVNDESIAGRIHLLPEDTQYVRIEGGDHHQFGSYEIKPENDHAEISRGSQHEQIIQATLEILQAISE